MGGCGRVSSSLALWAYGPRECQGVGGIPLPWCGWAKLHTLIWVQLSLLYSRYHTSTLVGQTARVSGCASNGLILATTVCK